MKGKELIKNKSQLLHDAVNKWLWSWSEINFEDNPGVHGWAEQFYAN